MNEWHAGDSAASHDPLTNTIGPGILAALPAVMLSGFGVGARFVLMPQILAARTETQAASPVTYEAKRCRPALVRAREPFRGFRYSMTGTIPYLAELPGDGHPGALNAKARRSCCTGGGLSGVTFGGNHQCAIV